MTDADLDRIALEVMAPLDGLSLGQARAVLRRAGDVIASLTVVDTASLYFSAHRKALSELAAADEQ